MKNQLRYLSPMFPKTGGNNKRRDAAQSS